MSDLQKYVNPMRVLRPIGLGIAVAATANWVSEPATGVALFVASTAIAALGATLTWQSFTGYDKALIDADGMFPRDRDAMRASLRRDRKKLGYSLVLLIAGAALGTIAGNTLKDGSVVSVQGRLTLAFFGGAGLGISVLTTLAVWRLFFSLDDFKASIRDKVREEQARLRVLAGLKDDASRMDALRTDPSLDWKLVGKSH